MNLRDSSAAPSGWLMGPLLACVLVCILMAAEFVRQGALPPEPRARLAADPLPVGQSPGFGAKWQLTAQGHLPMPPGTPAAHASNLLAMPVSHPCVLMAFWFAGQRESAPDVQIASSCFERAGQRWSAASFVVNRDVVGTSLGFGVRRLGNPVAWLDGKGQIHLFVVATGLGGWAASRVLHLQQVVQAQTGPGTQAPAFAAPRLLPLGWLWNTSHLVRGAPLPLQDGGMVLPAYFEIGVKYPVALRFDAAGNFRGMTRMSKRRDVLQPTLIALNDTHWLALMRANRVDGNIAVAQSGDGGQTWRDLRDLNLLNPDASVVATSLGPWHFVLAHNSSPKSRQVLDLSESGNGIDWTRVHTLAAGDTVTAGGQSRAAEFSYPAMVWADSALWVSFTENRQRIAWQRFEMAKP